MPPEAPAPHPLHANAATRTAAILVGLEAIAVAALAAWMIPSLFAGETMDLATAWALILMTGLAAVALFAFAIAVLRGHGWGRSGAIVAQLLILAVALGAATGAYAHPMVALALAAPAVITLVLVIAAARAAGRRDAAAEASP